MSVRAENSKLSKTMLVFFYQITSIHPSIHLHSSVHSLMLFELRGHQPVIFLPAHKNELSIMACLHERDTAGPSERSPGELIASCR